MKTICTTGVGHTDLQGVNEILLQAGMKAAKPAKRDDPIDMGYWHEQVLSLVEDTPNTNVLEQPGKLWEQLAGDIFLANIKSPVWGWADPRSTWLLDFWLNFEPQLYFILVCVSPQQMLANSIADSGAEDSVSDAINTWQAHHQEMLRFHHRNPQRSLLVSATDCLENPGILISTCVDRWQLPLTDIGSAASGQVWSVDPLAGYLAERLCETQPQTANLQQELEATVFRLGSSHRAATATLGSPQKIIAAYRQLSDRSGELQQLQTVRDEWTAAKARLKDAEQENELLLLQLHQVQEELEATFLKHESAKKQIDVLTKSRDEHAKLAAERLAQSDQLTKARDEQSKLATERQTSIGTLTQERDNHAQQAVERQAQIDALTKTNAALAQEKSGLTSEKSALAERHDALQAEVATLTKTRDEQTRLASERAAQIDQLTKTRDEQSKLATERQTRIGTLTQERDNHAQQAVERQAQIDALTKANAVLTQEKLGLTSKKSALAERRDALQAEVVTLTKTRDEQTRLASERAVQIDQLTKTLNDQSKLAADRQTKIDQLNKAQHQNKAEAEATRAAEAKLRESQQENELLLLQLHQVQEELEHYFLQHQEAQRSLEKEESRWQRMLKRNPAYCDYQSIEIVAGESTSDNNIQWRLTDLNAAGRNLPNLEFHTFVEDGTAGFLLSRKPDTPAPLLRWPAVAANQSELALIPAGTHANVQQRVECLLDIATSDWDLLQTLARLLTEALATPATLKAPANFNPVTLRASLKNMTETLQKFPATLRYDQVTLKREQVNPDYEHLWLKFDNLALGAMRWPQFEFRLSCANVRPNRFGNNPKLEFPEEGGQVPFQNWFIESYDDFGAKLELRFALPESMDMAVWQRLSDHDRAFISALISRLPAIFASLQSAGVKLKRSWEDWHKIAKEVQRVIALRTASPNLPAPQTEHAVTPPSSSTTSRVKISAPLAKPAAPAGAKRKASARSQTEAAARPAALPAAPPARTSGTASAKHKNSTRNQVKVTAAPAKPTTQAGTKRKTINRKKTQKVK